jgi:hypothetical protein
MALSFERIAVENWVKQERSGQNGEGSNAAPVRYEDFTAVTMKSSVF